MSVDDLRTKISQVSSVIDNIAADIAFIKSKLPTEGSATAEQVAEINGLLDALVTKVTTLDSENPPAE